MNSLTPFIRHEMDEQPGASSAPENSCSRCSPPLGKEPEAPVILPPGDPTAARRPHCPRHTSAAAH